MLRCRSIASLQRTVGTPPLVDFSRASHLDPFEQPAKAFFQHPTSGKRNSRDRVRESVVENSGLARTRTTNTHPFERGDKDNETGEVF